MTLTITVEDGTGVTGANAYESAAATATRLTDLGLTVFSSLSAANQAAALYRGTASIERRIQAHLTGRRTVSTQGLSYPRAMSYYRGIVIERAVIPEDLLLACAYESESEAQRISDAEATRAAPGVKRAKTPAGAEIEWVTNPGQVMALSLLDDRAAAHVRALISRRAA